MSRLALLVAALIAAWAMPAGDAEAALTPGRGAGRVAGPEASSAEQAAQAGQGGRRAGRPGPGDAPASVQDVERMWDQFLLAQARAALELDDDQQFRRFSVQLQNLQNLRRRLQRQRNVLQRELNQLVESGAVMDRTAAEAKLAELDEFGVRSAQQVRRAFAEIDRVLTLRQRVHFRAFDNRMAQRKLELIAQARANTRGRPPAP